MYRISVITRIGLSFLLPALLIAPLSWAAASGGARFTSYFQRIPAPPQTTAEAHTRVKITADTQGHKQFETPELEALMTSLNQEAALASSEMPGVLPGTAQAGDAAAAERLALQMENMSDAQKMAMAMHMANGMNSTMQAGMQGGKEWSPAEQEFARLLGDHMDRDNELLSKDNELAGQPPALIQAWGADHAQLGERMQKELGDVATEGDCNVWGARRHAIELNYAVKQDQMATGHLPQMNKIIGSERQLVSEQTEFVDRLTSQAKAITSPINKSGYAQARQFASHLLVSLLGMTEQVYVYATEWHDHLLERQKPYVKVDCGAQG